jgi:hypothetical protein
MAGRMPGDPEFSYFNMFWIYPKGAQAARMFTRRMPGRYDDYWTFYKTIKSEVLFNLRFYLPLTLYR